MRALVLLTLLASNIAIADGTAAPWRDDFTARLEALALLQSLNAELLSHDSATLTLDRWCASHQLATPATIVAERIRNVDKQPTAEQRELLKVSATEPLRYRRVHLKCGERVLSEADNWYVPARLTKEMNQSLENSDIAFGRGPCRGFIFSAVPWPPSCCGDPCRRGGRWTRGCAGKLRRPCGFRMRCSSTGRF
jgi:hypothetical protein